MESKSRRRDKSPRDKSPQRSHKSPQRSRTPAKPTPTPVSSPTRLDEYNVLMTRLSETPGDKFKAFCELDLHGGPQYLLHPSRPIPNLGQS